MSSEPTSEVQGLRRRVAELEEELAKRDHRLSLATAYDNAKGARIQELEVELAGWRKLKDPEILLASLVQDVPATLDRAQAGRLLMTRPILQAPQDTP